MIRIVGVRHEVAGRVLFSSLNAVFGAGKKTGLVGNNGIGKSTLAKILSGDLDPSEGQVFSEGKVIYFPQFEESSEDVDLSEYLAEIWDSRCPHYELMVKLIQHLDLSKPLSVLSGGEWMRARLARVLAESPQFLILDEPTNNLDREGRDCLIEFIAAYCNSSSKQGLLVISHDREILNSMDAIVELSSVGLKFYGGNFDFYWQAQNEEQIRIENEISERKRMAKNKERERVEKITSQEKRMRNGKKTADDLGLPRIVKGLLKIKAQESLNKIKLRENTAVENSHLDLEDAIQRKKKNPFLRFDFEAYGIPPSKISVKVENLNIRYQNTELLWKESLDWIVQGPERWHLRGSNGAGKSSLIKAVLGMLTSNEISSGDTYLVRDFCYLDQRFSILDPELTVLENILEQTRFEAKELRNELAFFGFTNDQALQKVKTLSGGETLKASLAKMFLGPKIPEIVILDEPTNNLDLTSIEYLEQALKNFKGTLIVVSHDLKFVENLGITNELWIGEKRL